MKLESAVRFVTLKWLCPAVVELPAEPPSDCKCENVRPVDAVALYWYTFDLSVTPSNTFTSVLPPAKDAIVPFESAASYDFHLLRK